MPPPSPFTHTLRPPLQISLAEFTRDLDEINRVYVPTAHKSGLFLQRSLVLMFSAFIILVIMGIIGEFAGPTRDPINYIALLLFLCGLVLLGYSKSIEQGGIRAGAEAVRALLDSTINARYASSEYKVRWTIVVKIKSKVASRLGQSMMERPVLSIYALRSTNSEGHMQDWVVPGSLLTGLWLDDSKDGEVRVFRGAGGVGGFTRAHTPTPSLTPPSPPSPD